MRCFEGFCCFEQQLILFPFWEEPGGDVLREEVSVLAAVEEQKDSAELNGYPVRVLRPFAACVAVLLPHVAYAIVMPLQGHVPDLYKVPLCSEPTILEEGRCPASLSWECSDAPR